MNFYHELERLERYGIYDLSDVYSDEEIANMAKEREQEYFNAPVSMDSLGLTWRDFL